MVGSEHRKSLTKRELEILSSRYSNDNTPINFYHEQYFTTWEFRQKYIHWCAISGVSIPPDQVIEEYMTSIIRSEWGDMTFQEIELALKMNLLGDFSDVIEPYNNFNIRFLSAIIRAYKIKRSLADSKMYDIKRLLDKAPLKEFTPEEIELIHVESIVKNYQSYLNDHTCLVAGLATSYDFLLKKGIVSVEEEVLDKNINMEIDVLISEAKRNINSLNAIAIEAKIKDRSSFRHIAILQVKHRFMLQYYQDRKGMEITPGELAQELQDAITNTKNI